MDRDTYMSRINKTQFPFETDSFFDFHNAMKDFSEMFEEAKRGGICFVQIFIYSLKHRIDALINRRVQEATDQQREYLVAKYEREFGTGDEEYDNFRRRCLSHDWYYNYTDDGEVWRRANKIQKELEEIVKTKGGKYQEYWDYMQKTMAK